MMDTGKRAYPVGVFDLSPAVEKPFWAQVNKRIEIKDKTGSLLTVLKPEPDGVQAWVDCTLNGECTLELELPATNNKIQYITDENFIYCDNREFVLEDLNSVTITKNEKGEIVFKAKARESWCLLDKRHITVCNDADYDPNDLEVIITEYGASTGGYSAGTAGCALAYLLQGSGWTLDVCDVTGIRELRTQQESVLSNIKNVQSLWGGYLVWDSVNHKLSLRSDDTWRPNAGYEIRFSKNQLGIERNFNYNVVTKMWVFGQNDVDVIDVNTVHSGSCQGATSNTITLDPAAVPVDDAYTDSYITVNGEGKKIISYNGTTKVATVDSNWTTVPASGTAYTIKARFLLDFSYSYKLRSYVYRNQDISNPDALLDDAQKALSKLSSPRCTYRIEHADLRVLAPYQHESFSVGDIVTVIDDQLALAISVRVIRHKYNVFQPWECDIELGEESQDLTNIIADLKKKSIVSYRLGRSSSTIIVADAKTSKNAVRADYIVPSGSTSAETIINRAIGQLGSAGGRVVLLEGTYIISNSIILPDRVTLEGQGVGTVIKLNNGISNGIHAVKNRDTTNGNSDIAIRNIKFDGNKALLSSGGSISCGIYLMQVTNVVVDNCTCDSFVKDGIWIVSKNGGVIVKNNICSFNNVKGIQVEGTDCKVTGNVCTYNGWNGVAVFNGDALTQVMNNTAKNNSQVGIDIYSSNGVLIQGNVSSYNGYDGIRLYVSSNCAVVSNSVEDNNKANNNACGISIETASSSYNVVQTNKVRRGSTPTHVYGVSVNGTGNIVTNNDLYQSGTSGALRDLGTGTITAAGNRL